MAINRGARSGGTDLAPGFVTRVAQGVRWALGAAAPSDWFGPMQPMNPLAPPEVAGRQFDYPVGYNLVTQPRPYEPVSFDQLRGLADSYDLLRLVIETRKDQIARQQWTVQPRKGAARSAGARAEQAVAFLAMPDREHSWSAWLRMVVEDMLVIDAATIYPRRSENGALFALEPVDGATIKRVLDDWGRTPEPPAPAYQQILKGLPAVDYRADELLYLPRNPRTSRVYGYSPVEQVVMTVNIALRRQMHQLQYYTEGSVPEALIGVPETWTPDQIGQFQSYWDSLLEGDTAQRRHARFVPATISKSFIQIIGGLANMSSAAQQELNPTISTSAYASGYSIGAIQRWPGKFGQRDKWIFCLKAATMPRIRRREHDEAYASEPHTGIQGEGGCGRDQGREDACRVGAAV